MNVKKQSYINTCDKNSLNYTRSVIIKFGITKKEKKKRKKKTAFICLYNIIRDNNGFEKFFKR